MDFAGLYKLIHRACADRAERGEPAMSLFFVTQEDYDEVLRDIKLNYQHLGRASTELKKNRPRLGTFFVAGVNVRVG